MYRSEPKIAAEAENADNSYSSFVRMEDLSEKLKLLSYEKEFVREAKVKPINRHYFMVARNPGEQFHAFSTLAAWLVRKTGKHFDSPQEDDDPNSTISTVLNFLRDFGFAVDFPPNKLKQGIGDQVVYVLDCLADKALEKNKFDFKRINIQTDDTPELGTVEDEAELILDRVEEEMAAVYSEESDEDVFHIEDLARSRSNRKEELNRINENTHSIDKEAWTLELERVLPRLKVTVRSDGRDWRSHLNQMKAYRTSIDDTLSTAKGQLEKLQRDVTTTLEKISSRERHLNKDLEPLLDQYRQLQDELSKAKDEYKELSTGIAERTQELARLTDQLDAVKQQMEDRGSSMTDGTPLINIKKAVAKVKAEIVDMDVRMGVIENTLLQARVRDKMILEEDMSLAV